VGPDDAGLDLPLADLKPLLDELERVGVRPGRLDLPRPAGRRGGAGVGVERQLRRAHRQVERAVGLCDERIFRHVRLPAVG
jgi:hypothetical protein